MGLGVILKPLFLYTNLIIASRILMTGKSKKITLTKSDIANALYQEVGLSKAESCDLVDSILSHISETLIRGSNVKITNFGKFNLSLKKERVGRNPKTGERVVISRRKVVTFKPSPYLLRRVNSGLKKEK